LDLPTARLTGEGAVRFTIFWPKQNRWEGADFQVGIVKAG
jgi:glucoamylase